MEGKGEVNGGGGWGSGEEAAAATSSEEEQRERESSVGFRLKGGVGRACLLDRTSVEGHNRHPMISCFLHFD